MELYFFRSQSGVTNFGDELNPWLWPKIIPELRRSSGAELLVGIGTLLNDLLPAAPTKHILGTGAGYGNGRATPDRSWQTHFVRGPLTAEVLGLPSDRAITDGAILIPDDMLPSSRGDAIGFMPHWESPLDSWKALVCGANMQFIDPTEPVEVVLRQLAACRLVITEAMHGAIVADLMRIPWVPVVTRTGILDFKWRDWTASLALDYAPVKIPRLWPPRAQPTITSRARRWAKFKQIQLALLSLGRQPARWQLSKSGVFEGRRREACSRLEVFREQLTLDAQRVREA